MGVWLCKVPCMRGRVMLGSDCENRVFRNMTELGSWIC